MTIAAAVMWSMLASGLMVLLLVLARAVRPGSMTDLVSLTGCTAVAYLVCIYLIARVHASGMTLSDLLGVRRTHPGFYALGALLGVALQVPAELLHRAIERRWPTPPEVIAEQVATFRIDTLGRRVMVSVVVACLGPLVEEMFFRGALHRTLRRVHADALVVPAVAALFAAGHLDPRVMLPIFVVGVVLGLVRAASGSLLPALSAHVGFNAVVVFGLLSGMMTIEADVRPLPRSVVVGGLASTAVLLAAVLLLARTSARAAKAREEDVA
jgi:membrane protease YdiL (CAAX protease family)